MHIIFYIMFGVELGAQSDYVYKTIVESRNSHERI